jgi:hypothetical protein
MAQATFSQHATVQQDGQGNPFLTYTGSSGAVLFQINSAGNITQQGGLPVTGIGAIVAVVSITPGFAVFNTAAPVSLLSASAPAGTYEFQLYMATTTAFVTNTEETITLGYTDDAQAQTSVYTTTAKSIGNILQADYVFRSNGTAAITYTPAVTGSPATAGAAAISIILTRLA